MPTNSFSFIGQGRLFVVGDAAHIHSPAGGQGMNTGIQDAINLAWKVARALKMGGQLGEAEEKLLDSYNAERQPVGQKLLQGTDRMFWYGSSTDPFFIWCRNLFVKWIMPWLASSPQRRAQAFSFISQLGIRYRRSPLVATSASFRGAVAGGDRAPDGLVQTSDGVDKFVMELCPGDRHVLLLFSGQPGSEEDMASAAGVLARSLPVAAVGDVDVLKVYYRDATSDKDGVVDIGGKLHKAYGFDKPGYVLVRPDTYIAHIGLQSSMESLAEWLRTAY